ncbi:hypothetical protein FGO68_gene2518 [Halteria grandinella]|uniref:Uncharacterized protein n=1 Tax=Halteria grandinella TaxID=5974 RepID=A0A8J8NKY7_HALGN|nr:hypothetical protein FGO68_gene2518 [Halteria grandinella]
MLSCNRCIYIIYFIMSSTGKSRTRVKTTSRKEDVVNQILSKGQTKAIDKQAFKQAKTQQIAKAKSQIQTRQIVKSFVKHKIMKKASKNQENKLSNNQTNPKQLLLKRHVTFAIIADDPQDASNDEDNCRQQFKEQAIQNETSLNHSKNSRQDTILFTTGINLSNGLISLGEKVDKMNEAVSGISDKFTKFNDSITNLEASISAMDMSITALNNCIKAMTQFVLNQKQERNEIILSKEKE